MARNKSLSICPYLNIYLIHLLNIHFSFVFSNPFWYCKEARELEVFKTVTLWKIWCKITTNTPIAKEHKIVSLQTTNTMRLLTSDAMALISHTMKIRKNIALMGVIIEWRHKACTVVYVFGKFESKAVYH